jgi:hypothetical protein
MLTWRWLIISSLLLLRERLLSVVDVVQDDQGSCD